MKNGPALWDEILHRLTTPVPNLGVTLASSAVIAGGAVRDYMLDLTPADIDVFIVPWDLDMHASFAGVGLAMRPDSIMDENHEEYDHWSRGDLTGLMTGIYIDNERQQHKVQLIYRASLNAGVADLCRSFDSEINKVAYSGNNDVAMYGKAKQDFEHKTYTCDKYAYSPSVTFGRYQRFNYRNPGVLNYVAAEGEDQPISSGFDLLA